MSIKLIIFDLDGTLIDSIADITCAVNYAIIPLGFEKKENEEIGKLVGGGISGLIGSILEGYGKNDVDLAIDRFMDYYSLHPVDHTLLYPGVLECLDELADYKKGVISNKREVLVKKILAELGVAGRFCEIFGSDSAAEKKPSPLPVKKMMDLAGVKKEHTVIVGDGEADIGAGRAAGIKTVSVTYGYRTKDQLVGADYYIDAMSDFPSLLKRI